MKTSPSLQKYEVLTNWQYEIVIAQKLIEPNSKPREKERDVTAQETCEEELLPLRMTRQALFSPLCGC